MISSLVTTSPADWTRTSTISKARVPKGTATPLFRSSRRARSTSHDSESKTDARCGAGNLVIPHSLRDFLGLFRNRPRNGCVHYAIIPDPGIGAWSFRVSECSRLRHRHRCSRYITCGFAMVSGFPYFALMSTPCRAESRNDCPRRTRRPHARNCHPR